MKNVSNLFKEELNNGNRNFVKSCTITLKDGTVLNITQADAWQNGFSIDEAVSNDSTFDIGSAIMDEFTLHLNNIYENFSAYDFEQAVVSNVRIGLNLSNGTTEYVKRGVYTVDEANYNGSIITLNCFDNMHKFDKEYSLSNLSYPTTLLNIVQDACSWCDVGMSAEIATFDNSSFVVNERPSLDGLTFRKVLTWVSQISGIWFKCNETGQLTAKVLDTSAVDKILEITDGGTFNPWVSDSYIDGGTFKPWSDGDSVDGGVFNDTSKYHHIYSIVNPDFATDDVVITGIQVKEQKDEEVVTYLNGSNGYVLSIEENNLIQGGKGQIVANYLGEKFIGLRFRPLTISCLTDPTIEAGDLAFVTDRHNRSYFTIITHTTLTPGQFQIVECNAESPQRNSADRYSKETQVYQEFRKSIQKERTEREKAIENLGKTIGEASGMYATNITQENGSVITYWHDKPKLEESKNVIIVTSEAIGFSTDGGKTYPNGITINGEIITRLLYAEGINADYINTGSIMVKDSSGNVMFSVDMDTGAIHIDGSVVRIGGKNAYQALSDAVTESKTYSDSKLADYADAVTKDVENLQAQIDGQIATYYYDYEPTLFNYPASEWTTTEERTKHIGDIFYWKSQGYSYRFFQDGSTWKWQLVKDTDITQAMAAAEQAQDTADGKRRVFVVQPVPPYDIGDLWSQSAGDGGELLTCTVSRASGSYVSSDWEKYNKYTDDTKANEALEAANNARALSIIMTNEYQGVPTDANGNYTTLPVVATIVKTYFGHTDVSDASTYSISTSSGITGTWNSSTRTYTVTSLTAETAYVDIIATYMSVFTVTKRFTVAKVRAGQKGEQGLRGLQGEKGEQGIQGPAGEDGVNGKTTYFHIKYSSVYVPTTSEQMTETPSKYIGTYVDYTEEDSTNPSDYTWSQFIGDDGSVGPQGEQGIPGKNGENGKTSYLHIKYSNDGGNTFTDNNGETVGDYIGQYVDYTEADSNSVSKYKWSKIKGEQGAKGDTGTPGRTYFLQPSTLTMKIGADSIFSPKTVTFSAFYRDGTSATRTAYPCRFVISVSVDGTLYSNVYTSSSDETSCTYTPSSTSIVAIRCTMYAAGGTSTQIDRQSVSVLIDIDNLSQEQVFNILTNNGETQGLYYLDGKIYLNASYIKAGTLSADLIQGGIFKVGGSVLTGYGGFNIYDSTGSLKTTLNNLGGLRFYNKNNSSEISYMEVDLTGMHFHRTLYSGGVDITQFIEGGIDFDFLNNSINAQFKKLEANSFVLNASTVTSGTTAVFDSNNYLRKLASSSERYKDIARTLTDEDVEDLYDIDVYLAKYKDDHLDETDERYHKYMPMFTVENIGKYLPIAVNHNEDGSPEMWNQQIMIAVMFQMIKGQNSRIKQLERILGIKEETT